MKTWRVRQPEIQNHLTVGLAKPLTYKPMALYSLFERKAGRYIRISNAAYTEALAIRVFAYRLAKAPLSYSIRPVAIAPNRAQGASRFRQASLRSDERVWASNWEAAPQVKR